MTPVGTIWRRALRRVDRRAAAYKANPTEAALLLLADACRLANVLARIS